MEDKWDSEWLHLGDAARMLLAGLSAKRPDEARNENKREQRSKGPGRLQLKAVSDRHEPLAVAYWQLSRWVPMPQGRRPPSDTAPKS